MSRTLRTLLAAWMRSLRTIADLHPGVFGVSDWSSRQPDRETYSRHATHKPEPTRPPAAVPSASTGDSHPLTGMRSRPTAEQRPIKPTTSKLIVK
jgi:hypothetical protein